MFECYTDPAEGDAREFGIVQCGFYLHARFLLASWLVRRSISINLV